MQLSVHLSLQRRFDESTREHAYTCTNATEHRTWRRQLHDRLYEITGMRRMIAGITAETSPMQPDLSGRRRERIIVEVEPGVAMPVVVLFPSTPGPHPVMIAAHGHCSGGKQAVIGDRSDPDVADAIDQFNYSYGLEFVDAGFVTFCPDARGFGERQEERVSGVLAGSCQYINHMALPLGLTVTGMWTWDLLRLVDYIGTRPDCDSRRIGCAGLSGGGLQTLWAAALDERIRCAVVSGYFYGYRESLLDEHHNCSCNFVPHLFRVADMGELAAMVAPRPLLIESGSDDPLNGASGLANVRGQLATAQRAYAVTGASENIAHDVFRGGHRWSGRAAVPWLKHHLL